MLRQRVSVRAKQTAIYSARFFSLLPFFVCYTPYKKILVSVLLIPVLCSFKKDKKEKSQPAITKGSFSAIAAYGIPGAVWKKPTANRAVTRGALLVGAEYQVARWFSTGLLYSYYTAGTGMQPVYNRYSGTPYQRDQKTQHSDILATADFYYLNRGKVCIGSGIALGPSRNTGSEHVIDSMGIVTYRTLALILFLISGYAC